MKLKDTPDSEIKLNTASGIYYYRGTPKHGGENLQRSLGVKNFKEAQKAKRKLVDDLAGLDLSNQRVTFNHYFDVEFLAERKTMKLNTYESALNSVKAMRPFFGRYPIGQLSEDLWKRYLDWNTARTDQFNPSRLLDYDKRHITMIAKRLQRAGVIRALPEFKIPSTKGEADRNPRRVFSIDEIRRLREATKKLNYHVSRDVFSGLILMLYKTGMRTGEALNLSWDRVDLVKNVISLRSIDTKTGKARDMKIPPDVTVWLNEWRSRNSSLWVFPARIGCGNRPLKDIRKVWNRLCDWAEVPAPNVPYCLRHTFLTECSKKIREGKLNLAVVAKYAGTSIKMIETHYLHIGGEDTKEVSELLDAEI